MRDPDPAQLARHLAQASLHWSWFGKVLASLLLISHFAWQYPLLHDWPRLPALISIPYAVLLVLVISAGSLSLLSFHLIRSRKNQPFQLITDRGPYRFVRHPMYSADLLLGGAFALFPLTIASLALWALLLICVVLQARHEDRLLATSFPEAHSAWRRRSGLLIPRL